MFKSRIILAVLASALLHGAEANPSPALLVLSKADRTLSIVDPATLKVVARMPSGPDPHEVVASSDGKYAYISNYGGGAYNTITVVDLVAHKTLTAIDLGAMHGPHGLDYAGNKLWFTAESNKVIGSYDPETKKIDWILGTGQDRTHMIFVMPDLTHMITSNVSSATMSFIEKSTRRPGGPPPGGPGPGPGGPPPGGPPRGPNGSPQGDWEETVVPVGRGAEGFDLTPDGKELWAANAQDGTISILDVAAKKVIQTLNANVRGANRLKVTPNGKLALVSTLGGADLTIFDIASRKEVKRIPIGKGAAGIQMQPDGARAFVACTPDSYVVIIDLKTLEMTGKFDAGKNPDGMAWVARH
jgi:YVTN family beta-propeller protein